MNIPDALGNIGGAVAGFAGVSASDSASRRNDRLQRNIHGLNQLQAKEFARYGIQYRVSDALEAGINPLAALGANISSPAPPERWWTSGGCLRLFEGRTKFRRSYREIT